MFSGESELMEFIFSSWKKFHKLIPHTTVWRSASSRNLHSMWTGLQLMICRQGIGTSGNAVSCSGRQVLNSLCYNLPFVWWSFRLQHREFSNFLYHQRREQRNNQYKQEFMICFPDSVCSVSSMSYNKGPLGHGTIGHRGDEDTTQGLSSALYFSHITSVVFWKNKKKIPILFDTLCGPQKSVLHTSGYFH